MLIRIFVLALLMSHTLFSWAEAREITLSALISTLQREGHTILYSNQLMNPAQRVRIDSIDLESLARVLATLNLKLEQQAGVWVISRDTQALTGPPIGEAPVVDVEILETVIVTGTVHRFPYRGPASSSYSFSAADVSLLPSLGSDAMRAALRLPGVATTGVSAKPRIRGGLQDELLVMQDGVELLEPFHLADYHSAYSTIDYHTIESLDVYTGGFPSRYGNRMSGVIDIQNQWQDDEYNTDIGVSSFSQFVHTRGEFGSARPARWLLSARRGDLTDLTGYIETRSGDPRYADASARINVELSDKLNLTFGAVYSEDDIVFEDQEERATSQIETRYLWGGADWQPRPGLRSRLTGSWLDFERQKNLGSFEEEEKGGFLNHNQQVKRLAVRNDWSALAAGVRLEFGWQAEYNDARYRHTSRIDRGELGDLLNTQRLVMRDLDVAASGWSGGLYLQGEWDLSPNLTLQPSIRGDVQNYYLRRDARYQVSPRLGLAYQINPALRARASVGRFYQPEGIQELQVLDGLQKFFAPQHSDQLVVALDWQGEALRLVGEIYYKEYGDQKGRFENVFNPFVLLPEMEPDRISLQPERALVTGLDLDSSFAFSEFLSGNFRYSYMQAQDRIEGRWVDRRWSQKHTVNTGLVWQKGSFSMSLALTWHSGWRSTQLPEFIAEDTVIAVESVLNNVELREYFSVDVGLRKSWDFPRAQLQVYADISNLTDRRNQAGIDFDVLEEVADGFSIGRDGETLLGRVPSVGITLSF